jgi:hypothetical protein
VTNEILHRTLADFEFEIFTRLSKDHAAETTVIKIRKQDTDSGSNLKCRFGVRENLLPSLEGTGR